MTKRRDRGGLSPVRSAGTALGVLATFFLTACDSSDVQETQQLEAATSEQDHPNIVVVIADQMRWPARAVATARSTSAGPAVWTWAMVSPVAGFTVAKLAPD